MKSIRVVLLAVLVTISLVGLSCVAPEEQGSLDAVEQRLDAVEQRLDAVAGVANERGSLDAVEKRLDAVEKRLDGVTEVVIDSVDEQIVLGNDIEKVQVVVEKLLGEVPVPSYVTIGRLRVEDSALRLGGIPDAAMAEGMGLSQEAWDAAEDGKEPWTIRMLQGTIATIVFTTDDGRTTMPYTIVIEGMDVRQPLKPFIVDNNTHVVKFNKVGEFRVYVEEAEETGAIPEGLIIVEPFKF